MGRRKKERIFSIEFPEEDTLHPYYNPILNFVAKENNLIQGFHECDVHSILKIGNNEKELEKAIKEYGKRQASFFSDICFYMEEISLSKPLKSSDKYLYRFINYNENKTGFCNFKEIVTYIKKKVKNKYAFFHYNSVNEKLVFSEDVLKNIITRMTAETHQITVNEINGKGEEDKGIIVIPFKIIE